MNALPPEQVAYGDQVHAAAVASLDHAVKAAKLTGHIVDDDMMAAVYLFSLFTEQEGFTRDRMAMVLSVALVRIARAEAS